MATQTPQLGPRRAVPPAQKAQPPSAAQPATDYLSAFDEPDQTEPQASEAPFESDVPTSGVPLETAGTLGLKGSQLFGAPEALAQEDEGDQPTFVVDKFHNVVGTMPPGQAPQPVAAPKLVKATKTSPAPQK